MNLSFFSQLTSRNISDRQFWISSQKCHLTIAKVDQSIEQFLHFLACRIFEQQTAMASGPRQDEVKMPDGSFSIVNEKFIIGRCNTCKIFDRVAFTIQFSQYFFNRLNFTFVERKSNIQLFELVLVNEIFHSINTADFLLGHKSAVNCSLKANSLSLEMSQCAEILHADTLHVLRATRKNSTFVIDVS